MFPNLKHAFIYSSSYLPLFFTDTIETLRITPARSSDSAVVITSALVNMSNRTTGIRALTISPGHSRDDSDVPHHDAQMGIGLAIRHWQSLTQVTFPLYYLLPSHLLALALLPNLEIVDIATTPMIFDPPTRGWSGPSEHTKSFLDEDGTWDIFIPPGSFPSLHTFGIGVADPRVIACLIQQAHFPLSQIRSLAFRISGPSNFSMAFTVRFIIQTLVERQSIVQDLLINTCALETSAIDTILLADQITYHDIRSIRALHHLQHVRLWHNLPISISEDDFFEMTDGWNIQSLVLNPSPIVLMDATHTIHTLIVAAQNCPNLIELGLFINTTENDIPCSTLSNKQTKLERLDLGLSHVIWHNLDRSRSIANFLTTLTEHTLSLLPRELESRLDAMDQCVITSDTNGTLKLDEDDYHYWTDEEWRIISSHMPTMRERNRERARSTMLAARLTLRNVREIKKDARIKYLEHENALLRQYLASKFSNN